LQGSDGNFYGMTSSSGPTGQGTVFKITSGGTFTLLHSFSNATTDGGNPNGSLVQGSDGNFYGLTQFGGANNHGTVFKITASGTFTLLHSFSSATTDGETPNGNLVQASDGNFYGMTQQGGANSDGTVFKITASGTFTLLHSFSTSTTDGNSPFSSLMQGSDGNLYGMTQQGGASSTGTIFKETISPTAAAQVTLSAPASVTHSTSFTLSYAVSNAYNTSGVTVTTNTTLQNCEYNINNGSGTSVASGALTGSTSSQNASLTAPATTGTYSLAVTCGGIETGTVSLVVN
jgi:uncharacterized repeat protein (TIGR03803 family)